MKACMLILVALCVYASAAPNNITKRSYGSGSYGRIELVRPKITTPIVQKPIVRPVVQKPVVRPVVRPVVSGVDHGYESGIMKDQTVAIDTLDPALRNLCLNKRVASDIYYLPHPNRPNFYIQCNQYGNAYLKECPVGTVFTQNLVCERLNEEVVPERETIEQVPLLDNTVGSYGEAPVFSAEQPATVEVSGVETLHEAPEFNHLCVRSSQLKEIFYVAHPINKHMYIQCDEYGRAFLKQCPFGLVFTRNLACEKEGSVIQETTVLTRPLFDKPVSNYGGVEVETTQFIREVPEFRYLCVRGGEHVSGIFYVAHPTDKHSYIQCDEFGKAFLRHCPAGLWFTRNLVCEKMVETETVVVEPSLDQVSGSYGAAPVFAAETTGIQTHSQVEVVREAPEFNQLCQGHNAYGAQVSTVFYIPHPTNKGMYIQCSEFGIAYLKTCPVGTIFTRRLTCEKVTEVIETVPAESWNTQETVVERPILRDESLMTKTYGAEAVVERPVVERPVVQRPLVQRPLVQRPLVQRPIVQRPVVQKPIMGEELVRPTTSYGSNY